VAQGSKVLGMVGMALGMAEDSTLEDNKDHKDRSIHNLSTSTKPHLMLPMKKQMLVPFS